MIIQIYSTLRAIKEYALPVFQHIVGFHHPVVVALHIHVQIFDGIVYPAAFLPTELSIAIGMKEEQIQIVVAKHDW